MDRDLRRVTLVFTDVQGSTTLWETVPDAMREALDLHNELFRRLIAKHRGYEVKTEGDAFMVAFDEPRDAVRFCLDAQLDLRDLPWPRALLEQPDASESAGEDETLLFRGLRVRMGLHCGEADCVIDPASGRRDYFGIMVNRAARVGAAGHGGQVVLSSEVREGAALREPPAGWQVTDLGEHGLKGLSSPMRLYSVSAEPLAGRSFPPLKTLDVRKSNLELDASHVIGRDDELRELAGLFSDGARIVTLLGPGGIGKTTLSRRLGLHLLDRFGGSGRGGVWFCDLASAHSAQELTASIAATLAVPLARGADGGGAQQQLGEALRERGDILLILDNLEQAVEPAASVLAGLAAAAPKARFAATSRHPLELADERLFELDSLSVDEAVRLFEMRAQARKRGWSADGERRREVESLVRDLDRLPLAIELAAARINVLSVRQLAEKISRSIGVLRSRAKDLPRRQATMTGAIDWSWDLLDDRERRGLAACSVFRGGFSLEALEAVVVAGEPDDDAEELAESLRRKSLVRQYEAETRDCETRFQLYESIRQYAAEKLGSERELLEERHADHYIGIAAGRGMEGARLERENLLAAYQRLRDRDPRRSARIVLALAPLLQAQGPAELLVDMIERVLRTPAEDREDRILEIRLRRVRSSYLAWRGEPALSDRDMARALELSESVGTPPGCRVESHVTRGFNLSIQSRLQEARGAFEEALKLSKGVDEPALAAKAHEGLAFINFVEGRMEAQLELLSAGLREARRARSPDREASILRWQGEGLLNLERYEPAMEALRRSHALAERLRDNEVASHCRRMQGTIDLMGDRFDAAEGKLAEALEASRQLMNHGHSAIILRWLAVNDLLRGEGSRAEARFDEARLLVEDKGFAHLEGSTFAFLVPVRVGNGDLSGARRAAARAGKILGGQCALWQVRALELFEELAARDPEKSPSEPPEEVKKTELYRSSVDFRSAVKVVERLRRRSS